MTNLIDSTYELIQIVSEAPKSCADCQHAEWVNDPYATGDSPGVYECAVFYCECEQAERDLIASLDKLDAVISDKEDNGEDCEDYYAVRDEAEAVIEERME